MTSRTDADVLVFREPAQYMPREKPAIWEEIKETFNTLSEEAWLQEVSQEEIIKNLEHYGYKAGIIHISDGKVQGKDMEFLESFAMSAPKVEPKEPPEI